jgi:hypothetical protein
VKKLITKSKWKKYLKSRSNSEQRKNRKKSATPFLKKTFRLQRKLYTYEDKRQLRTYKVLPAPKKFSFVDNTDEVLEYLKISEKYLKQKRGVVFDKSKVDVLTSDAIALFIGFLSGKQKYRGNSPDKPDLKKLFEESGFYDHVQVKRKLKDRVNPVSNLLHKEFNTIVAPEIAGDAVMRGIKHTGLSLKDTDPVYDILIECMQNTNNHASGNRRYGNCNWWLYVYNDQVENITKYSFVDLGIGIFKSLVATGLVKKVFKKISLLPNSELVDDLLSGKIQSRISEDNELRGKGIPQIVEYAKTDYFKRFYIIANDIKIDVKTGERWTLKNNMNCTFLYFELQNKRNGS